MPLRSVPTITCLLCLCVVHVGIALVVRHIDDDDWGEEDAQPTLHEMLNPNVTYLNISWAEKYAGTCMIRTWQQEYVKQAEQIREREDTLARDMMQHPNVKYGAEQSMELLRSYVQNHGAQTIKSEFAASPESICKRSYLVGRYDCPEQLGNRMGEFMNQFSLAVLTERTILVEPKIFNSNCSNYVSTDLLTLEDFLQLKQNTSCRHMILRTQRAHPKQQPPDYDMVLENSWALYKCCDFVSKYRTVVSRGVAEILDTPSLEGRQVSWSAENTLIEHSTKSKALTLFGESVMRGYGLLLSTAIQFRPYVTDPVHQLLHTLQGTVVIGVHLRHPDTFKVRNDARDTCLTVCVPKILQRYPGKECTIVLATDRQDTQHAIEESIGNELRKTTTGFNGCKLRGVKSLPKQIDSNDAAEHGPWSGFGAMADLYMMSQSYIFLGSPWSTFSERAAELFVARSAEPGQGTAAERHQRVIDITTCEPFSARPFEVTDQGSFSANRDFINKTLQDKCSRYPCNHKDVVERSIFYDDGKDDDTGRPVHRRDLEARAKKILGAQ